MRQYEKYINSGVEWLGMVPSHWNRCRFKNFEFLRTENSNSKKKIGLENIESKTGKFIVTNSEFDGNGVAFYPGDVVYGKLRPYLQKVWLAEFKGNAVGDFFVFKNKQNCNARFLFYLMLSDGFTSECNGATLGAKMPRVPSEFIQSLVYYLPSLDEQKTIADYLDEKTTLIDNIIKAREKKIQLLEELKTSIISKAVTKGIREPKETKDSGVEWIGRIPANWESSIFKRFLEEPMKYGANESAESDNRDWPRYIRITDIDAEGYLRDETFKSLPIDKAKDYLLENGDVLFARSGATVGKTYIHKGDITACYAGYLIKAKCNTKLLPDFLFLYTQTNAYENWKDSIFIQSTIQNIGADKYSYMPIVVPPITEQRDIVAFVRKKTTIVKNNIEKAYKEIGLLKEYRAALVTEVVTGKRKVV